MPWFRVDDDLALHPKALAAGDAALGLWVRAGSYSAKYLTEGRITRDALRTLRGRPATAQRLVDAGLWVVDPDGDGWLFHEWDERQPSREKVLEARAAAAERQRRARERAAQQRGADDAPVSRRSSRRDMPVDNGPGEDGAHRVDVEFGTENRPENDAIMTLKTGRETGNAAGQSVSSRRESRSPRPGPAQTPYVLTLVGRLAGSDARASTSLPADVIDAWQDYAGPVDLEREAAAYLRHYGDRPARDERAAWLGWLRKARERAEQAPRAPGCADCDAGWLPPAADDPLARPRRCPTCRPPHLRAV